MITPDKLNKRLKKWFVASITIVFVCGGLSSCEVLYRLEPEYWQEHTIATSRAEGINSINTDTILESLNKGEKDVFFPSDSFLEVPPAATPFSSKIVHWSQADYLAIAQAYHEYVWGESWQDWNINLLFFKMNCDQANIGAQKLYISLYKTVSSKEGGYRLIRDIDFYPSVGLITWSEYAKSPVREKWRSINEIRPEVPVEAAMKIAETNGGREARLAFGNKCTIYILLLPTLRGDYWNISYSPDYADEDFISVYIDPSTGEIR